MKKELLEYLVRACAKEVITQLNEGNREYFFRSKGRPSPILGRAFVNESDDIKGAAAPPADGQGTADQPPIPNSEPPIQKEPSQVETPPETKPLKGINIVNPRDKSKIDSIQITGKDDASIERVLHRKAASVAGPKVKISLGALRAVKSALSNPSVPLFLYIGKFDPESDELFLMAEHSLQVAKDSSVSQDELSSAIPGTYWATDIASPEDYDPEKTGANYAMKQAGYSDRSQVEPEMDIPDINESLRPAIKALVNEILNRK